MERKKDGLPSVEFVKWFSELSNKDVAVAGGKGASLAEMYNAKVPVPPGFVVTAQAYSYFLEKTGIKDKIKEVLEGLDIDNTTELNASSRKVREIIESQEFPQEMKDEIIESYDVLDVEKKEDSAMGVMEKGEEPFVAVRSSATTEDLVDASFAGQQETFLNVKGKEDLIEKVRKCMSSLFTPRAIFYREKKGFKHDQAYLSVVIQKMIDSEKSGVMFSQNPTKSDGSIVIEAVWGLGEGIVSGKIKPDHYEVDKDLETFNINREEISIKKIAIIRNTEGKNETVKLKEERAKKRVLDNYQIKRLAQFARQLEDHYKKPQDIEFAIDQTGIFIVQSRPITTIAKETDEEVEGTVLLSGLAASPGVSSGVVKIVKDMADLEKIQKGDVMVTEMTNPDMVVAMQKAAGIITDEGGITSHAAIVSREMGIPAVVGTGDSTSKLKEGDIVTVDGNHGKIIEGKGETKLVVIEPVVPTRNVKIKVIVDLPEAASRAAKSEVKGIGLTRLEGIIALGGKHPLKFVQDKNMEWYVNLLAKGIKEIISHFEEMWIRTSDIRSDEYRNLEGAPQEVEGNPMLGDHGIRFSLKHPEILKAELEAVKKIALENKNKQFGIMMPQIISIEEVRKTKEIAKQVVIPENVKIGIMVETPAVVQTIDDFIEEGIDFISFGTNDLTQYTLAIDRNNEEVQGIFDETHPAVINSIKHVIEKCKAKGVITSICGQAGSRPEMAKILVEAGIDSISVNADAARKISEIVAEIEKKTESGEGKDNIVEIVNDGLGDDGRDANGKSDVREGEAGEKEELFTAEGGIIESDNKEKVEEVEIKKEEAIAVPAIKVDSQLFHDEDVEAVALAALDEGDYNPGSMNGDDDVPQLNEAIPIGSESFEEEKDQDIVSVLNEGVEKVETLLEVELLEELEGKERKEETIERKKNIILGEGDENDDERDGSKGDKDGHVGREESEKKDHVGDVGHKGEEKHLEKEWNGESNKT